MIGSNIHIFFLIFFSIMVYPRILNIVPCTIKRTLSIHTHTHMNSFHLLILNSESLPLLPHHPALGNYKCVLCICEYFTGIHTPHLLYPFICWWVFRLFPCLGYCKIVLLWTQGCMYPCELRVLFGYMPMSGTAGSYGISFYFFCMFSNFFFFFF